MVNKYYKQELYVSHDGGTTWNSIGAFQKGALIEKDSPDCVYVPPTPPIYRWVTITPTSSNTTYICDECD